MSCSTSCVMGSFKNIFKAIRIDFMRKGMHKQPSFHISPPTIKQNLAVECRKKKQPLNTTIFKRQHHVSQHAIIQKPIAYFIKTNKQKTNLPTPQGFP